MMMVEHPSFFATDPRVKPIVDLVDGIAYEAHQFNRHWPLESGWSKPEKVIAGAKWTLEQGKDYVFYFGPIIWKGEQIERPKNKRYEPFVERKWLQTFWEKARPAPLRFLCARIIFPGNHHGQAGRADVFGSRRWTSTAWCLNRRAGSATSAGFFQ